MDEPSAAKRPSVLTIDRAAFLLLRVKRAFKKKRQQRKEKHAAAAAAAAEALGPCRRVPPPLLRSRTLPAIVVPGLSILHAQIDPANNDLAQSQMLCRGVSTHKVCGLRAHTPRISFTSKDEDAHEVRRKSASSRLGSSPRASIASDDRADGLVLRVPTPRGSVSSTGSSRLARLLTQGGRGAPEELTMDAPRRLSWERRESIGQLPRSASIDSMVEAAICARHSEPSAPTLAPPGRADRALSLVSPAVGRRAKTQRGQAGEYFSLESIDQLPRTANVHSMVDTAIFMCHSEPRLILSPVVDKHAKKQRVWTAKSLEFEMGHKDNVSSYFNANNLNNKKVRRK